MSFIRLSDQEMYEFICRQLINEIDEQHKNHTGYIINRAIFANISSFKFSIGRKVRIELPESVCECLVSILVSTISSHSNYSLIENYVKLAPRKEKRGKILLDYRLIWQKFEQKILARPTARRPLDEIRVSLSPNSYIIDSPHNNPFAGDNSSVNDSYFESVLRAFDEAISKISLDKCLIYKYRLANNKCLIFTLLSDEFRGIMCNTGSLKNNNLGILFAFYCEDSANIKVEYLDYILSLSKSDIFDSMDECRLSLLHNIISNILIAPFIAPFYDFDINEKRIEILKEILDFINNKNLKCYEALAHQIDSDIQAIFKQTINQYCARLFARFIDKNQ